MLNHAGQMIGNMNNALREVGDAADQVNAGSENLADASRQAVIDMVDDIAGALGTK